MPLRVRVVSPEREVFRGEAQSIMVPAWDGMLGVLPGHAPFLGLLGRGWLKIRLAAGEVWRTYVAGGVLKVEEGAVTVLVEYAGDSPPAVLPAEADFHPDDLLAEPAR